jgi:hypothetical protein
MPFTCPVNCENNLKLSYIQSARTFLLILTATPQEQFDMQGLSVQSAPKEQRRNTRMG